MEGNSDFTVLIIIFDLNQIKSAKFELFTLEDISGDAKFSRIFKDANNLIAIISKEAK